jgi:hypothetical protein
MKGGFTIMSKTENRIHIPLWVGSEAIIAGVSMYLAYRMGMRFMANCIESAVESK